MREKLIAPGVVDERSIERVPHSYLRQFTQCHFFAGIGGWSHALRLAGWPDDEPVWTGSCPCQSFSVAGEGRGFDDPRGKLWRPFYDLIDARRPPAVFGEQVANAIEHNWLDVVSHDLGKIGYEFGAAVFPAFYVGAPHKRQRLYFVADADGGRQRAAGRLHGHGEVGGFWSDCEWVCCRDGKRRAAPRSGVVAYGLREGVDLMRGAGNAIVPQQAAEFIEAFIEARG